MAAARGEPTGNLVALSPSSSPAWCHRQAKPPAPRPASPQGACSLRHRLGRLPSQGARAGELGAVVLRAQGDTETPWARAASAAPQTRRTPQSSSTPSSPLAPPMGAAERKEPPALRRRPRGTRQRGNRGPSAATSPPPPGAHACEAADPPTGAFLRGGVGAEKSSMGVRASRPSTGPGGTDGLC